MKRYILIFVLLITQNIILGSEYTITGKVLDSDSCSISDATIVFIHHNIDKSDTTRSDEDGNYSIVLNTNVGIRKEKLPSKFKLYQNYPNPFNPGTWIKFQIPDVQKVKIDIYNILGQRIKNLSNKTYQPGESKIYWNGTNNKGRIVSAGIYLYVMETKNGITSKKMLLLDGGSTHDFQPSFQQSNSVENLFKTLTNDIYSIRVIKEGFHNYFEDSLKIEQENNLKNMVLYSVDSLHIHVLEGDVLISSNGPIKQIEFFRKTNIINHTSDSLNFDVTVQVPDSLFITNDITPGFGEGALVTLYINKYFDYYPEINNSFIAGKPDISESEYTFTWNDLQLAPQDIYTIPWHNYYCKEMIDRFEIMDGCHQYFGLNIDSKYSIENVADSTYELEMDVEVYNSGVDPIYDILISWFIPRIIRDRNNDINYEFYDVISDTIITEAINTLWLFGDTGLYDGYGNSTRSGPNIDFQCAELLPNKKISFKYLLKLKKLLDKFEIHPRHVINLIQKSDIRMWEKSQILIPEKNIEVDNSDNYVKCIGSSIPTYYVFKIESDTCGVYNAWETDTTYYVPKKY